MMLVFLYCTIGIVGYGYDYMAPAIGSLSKNALNFSIIQLLGYQQKYPAEYFVSSLLHFSLNIFSLSSFLFDHLLRVGIQNTAPVKKITDFKAEAQYFFL